MATVITHAVASLDGFIARPDDSVGPLFDWYENGEVPLRGNAGDFGGCRPRRQRGCSRCGTPSGRW